MHKQIKLAISRNKVSDVVFDYRQLYYYFLFQSHGNGKCFSCRGIGIAVEHFRRRGHKEITVFVPQWRRQVPKFGEIPIKDQHILEDLGKNGILTFTPSRRLRGGKTKNIVCCGDRFVQQAS